MDHLSQTLKKRIPHQQAERTVIACTRKKMAEYKTTPNHYKSESQSNTFEIFNIILITNPIVCISKQRNGWTIVHDKNKTNQTLTLMSEK